MEITILVSLLLLAAGFLLLMAADCFKYPAVNYVGLPSIVVGLFLNSGFGKFKLDKL